VLIGFAGAQFDMGDSSSAPMADTSTEIPTLNPYTSFPFTVDPLDQSYLQQWCQFCPVFGVPDNGIPPDANHYEQ